MPISINGTGPVTGITSINTSVSDTELGYLDGVTSALQTQLDAKQNSNSNGLILINSSNPSAVSSLTLDNIFTTEYRNYLMVYNIPTISVAGADVHVQYRWQGATTSTAIYSYSDEYLRLDASQNGFNGGQNLTQHFIGRSLQSTEALLNGTLEILNPRAPGTLARTFIGSFVSCQNGGPRYLYRNASMVYDGSKDGIIISASSGTFTGTIRVYARKD